jgi:GntR family transcriptional regulator
VRETRYRSIADDLRRRLEGGQFGAARLLPSESELSEQYAASRVTVRRALEVLREEGLVDSRQGFGWFVATDPLRQTLGRLGTIERQLADEGVESTRRVLDFRFVPAPPRARQVLGCDTVLRVRRLNLADGQPFALVTVWCPEDYGAELSRADVERNPFYELLGIPLGGATQTIGAAAASAADAELLQVPVGSPLLRCERTTRSASGDAVLLSEHLFPAHLTEFEVDLPHPDPSMAPTGLRLVE